MVSLGDKLLTWDYGISWSGASQALRLTRRVNGG